ncbi:unnamed protein product [Phytophthora fragariaefolia]|uniref:Unnamed protein product n=1 Tax=Phytophthora fragariaefolia TaxID=1490495 RepID=A0A9W6U499_9STRA|nr:unnamed protein product [Phytophthora fragariaefolia]
MVKMPANTKGTNPATTGGRSSARPRSADAATKATASTPRSVKFDLVGDQDHGGDDDGSEDGLEMKGPRPILDDEEVDELTMVVGKSAAPRPIARRLGSEFDEVAPARPLAPDERPTPCRRPPVNGDTPNAYKILGQVGRSMVATSAWMMMFGPKEVSGAKWVTLEKELASPIDSSGLTQLAVQTKRLLEAMGFEWKRKLKGSFGVRSSTTVRKLDGVGPGTVPLPSTPKKALAGAGVQTPATKGDVFNNSAESPYFMDSHMITPEKSRGDRRINEDTDDEDDDDDYAGRDYADPCEDLAAQVRRSYHHEDDDGAQRIMVTHHISPSKLSKFNGTRNRSERSLRWLKKFIYGMEGTNTPQDRWCEPFQLCMEGCASNWIRQLPKKTRSKWPRLCEAFMAYYCSQYDQSAEDRYYTAKRDDDEHICDYLLRQNGYARSAWKRPSTTRWPPIADVKTEGIARASPLVKKVGETPPNDATIAEPIGKIAKVAAEVTERTDTAAKLRSPRHQSTSCNIDGRADGQNHPHGFMGDGRRDEARRPRWGDQDRRAGQNMDHARPVAIRVTPCTGASADASSAHKYTEMESASTTSSMRTRSSLSS